MQTSPTTWAFVTVTEPPKCGELPLPYVISDQMPPTEQVDGIFYESKRAFRAVGRALGLTEVGTEKPRPKPPRASTHPAVKQARRHAIRTAIARSR